jgi:hypothetical protein
MVDYLTRASAAAYLTDRLGRRVTVSSLARHASDQTGPRYTMVLGRASYCREWLDAWVGGLGEEPKKRPRRQNALAQETEGCREPSQATAPAAAVAAA